MELRDVCDKLETQDTILVALSQEDEDLAKADSMNQRLGGELPFELAYDLGREKTPRYDRTTAYLIDADGVVQEIFPMIIHSRPSAVILLREVMALQARRLAARSSEDDEG